jgi:hypothetical protein
MSEGQRVTPQEIERLPRWARLAFAARCVRRARALLAMSADPQQVVERALALVEEASHKGRADDELADAAAAAYTMALNHLDGQEGGPPPGPHGDEEDALVVACMVAHATAFAAEAATLADPGRAAQLVAQSVDFAIHACRLSRSPAAPRLIAAMRGDLERLSQAANDQGWDDQSPFPADFFSRG